MAKIFETSLFQKEVDKVIESGSKPVHYYLEAKLHSPAGIVDVIAVRDFTVKRDYLTKAFDIREITVQVNEGQYEKYIVPYKDQIEMTVSKIPLMESGKVVDVNNDKETYRYRAVLFNAKSSILEGNNPQLQDERVSQIAVVSDVRLQLMDLVVEQMRLITVGGIFRKVLTIDVIRTLLGKYSRTVSLPETSYTCLGVDIAPNHSETVREHVVVPHLTPLFDMPGYIHKRCGGVYAGGFGVYYQDNMWYVYPPFDVTRYDKTERTLTILNVPKNRMPQPERSYRITPTQIVALCTDDVKHIDKSEEMQLNQGNGVRFAHASSMFNGFGKTGGNKFKVERGKNISEFVYENRSTGVNILKESENRITDNSLYEYGNIAARTGSFLMITWEGSIAKFVYPGMPTRLMFLENGVVNQILGTVVDIQTYSVPVTKGFVEIRFMEKSVLTLFINRNVKFEEPL